MEINHKGRGFMRSKLAKAKSFFRVNHSKPNTMQVQCISNTKVSPSPYTYSPNGSNNSSSIQKIMSSAQPCPLPVQHSSRVTPTCSMDFPTGQSIQKVSASCQLGSYGGDENVDIKAASYISYVRERFKLEKLDSEAW
ncbi:conserved hypothetical protein [Ricinus communis]|uniref:Uncharacterized protein n=2 Tax=Ricinus communis TaxID=3988 RepID=B9RMC3_RICCO|nr:conserved hypothetical protein [Ricinus communis]|eukprot:XP_002514892.1 uncharacterized protein LOC8286774 [Ricinus communis]